MRDARRHTVPRWIRILEDAAGACRFERLRAFPEGERLTGHLAKGGWISAGGVKVDSQHHLVGPMQPAVVVSELHLPDRNVLDLAVRRHQADAFDQFRDEA